ncbi:Type I phosphodiesterase / nucleotide pyrophosphatase [Planctomycetes bacterium CA13]|uniref:Type I phosphodiesterase / nucleotide pyrophosphatase n=1 Tax=Novipirellula herctigrandis TaxID=2527986 RepID=A0A5C5Z3T4_9BACT|nr:Type I phosphodiesterase / nucleotide pyrophosphatase [Planctomycetes bacterium CA13]
MNRVCVINVVGLTPTLLKAAPNIAAIGNASPWISPLPAVTSTCQATMLTGLSPRDHGIVGNGWYFRDTQEIRFWQQANSLIQGPKLYEGIETAKLFWWFNQSAGVRYSATPKPHYGCDGSKEFDILDYTDCDLTARLGAFPFFSFWGPGAGLPCSRWIADAAAIVLREKQPQLSLVYLPHLDYDFQRYSEPSLERVREVDACAKTVIDAAHAMDTTVVVVSEYGLVSVDQPVMINRELRREGWLTIRNGPFGETMIPGECDAFAVCDHQLAHIYVRRPELIADVEAKLKSMDGIDRVVRPEEIGLDHPRSGELVALAKPSAWFAYYYWLDDAMAPDFARTVDIHRKPGYDPCELFMTSKVRAMRKLARKKLGFRYSMDVIPLDPTLVCGSHGLHPAAEQGPLIIGPGELPADMGGFPRYVRGLLCGEA